MNIILLENIKNLGNLGEQVSVKPGYGRNYLIPKKLAVMATKGNVDAFESRRAELEARAAENLTVAEARGVKLVELGDITITHRAGDEGKLFGSVSAGDIANAVTEAGVKLDKSEVRLPEGTLRQIGEFDISCQLHADVLKSIQVIIIPE